MKKFVLSFLCLMLILAVVPISSVGAENTPIITVGTVTAKQGNNVSVPISIANNPGIFTMAFCITYDTAALEYVTYEEGYLSDYNIKNHSDKGWLSFVNVEDGDCNNNEILFTLIFKVKEEAINGRYEIGIVNNKPDMYGDSLHNSFSNKNEQFIVPTVISGYVNVNDINKGDANDDGKINMKDYVLVLQKANGWDVELNEVNADVNGDNKINMKDYVLILQKANGWDVEFK